MSQPSDMKLDNQSNVPLRQFSMYRPPYEELYSFWWKCMQITLHDKGTQTFTGSSESTHAKIPNDDPVASTEPIDNKNVENDQLKQLMAMVNYYNSVGRESRSRVAKTFRGAGALAPGFSPSMLTPGLNQSTSTSTRMMDTTPVMEERPLFSPTDSGRSTAPGTPITSSTIADHLHIAPSVTPSVLMSTPVLNTPTLTPSSSTSSSPDSNIASPSTSNLTSNTLSSILTPAGMVSAVLSPIGDENKDINCKIEASSPIKQELTKKDAINNISLTTSSIFGDPGAQALSATLSAALLPNLQSLSQPLHALSQNPSPLLSQAMSQLTSAVTLTSPSAAAYAIAAPKLSPSTPDQSGGGKSSPDLSPILGENISFSDTSDTISDLIHIKQLTDVLGRKAVLDSLSPSISGNTDLSSYLGSTISMAQAASILGQLPTSVANRNLLGSLCMPLYNMEQALKTDGYTTLDMSNVKMERSARHYQAADTDTSHITLPEGFEVEEHLTWSEVEGFVNEFKTKRVKLGYTQAHVGAALALVHGPEFSQTTISRFEGLQLSFPNHKKIIPILRRWLESVENPAKRRHHSPNGLHGGNQNGNSKRRKRTTISSNSKEILEQYYQTNPLPSTDEIGNLSNNLALDKRVIRIWFQNRRAIGKRLSKLIVTMGGGASRNTALNALQHQQGLY